MNAVVVMANVLSMTKPVVLVVKRNLVVTAYQKIMNIVLVSNVLNVLTVPKIYSMLFVVHQLVPSIQKFKKMIMKN